MKLHLRRSARGQAAEQCRLNTVSDNRTLPAIDPPFRPLLPFAWRAWLWGTACFVASNGALLVGAWVAEYIANESAAHSPLRAMFRTIAIALVVAGPFGASAVGVAMGVVLGCWLAWRASHGQPKS